MGIKGLTPFLRRFAPSSLTPISINDLQNKTLAIDGTLFIQRFVKGADRGENSHPFPHVLGFYQLIAFLKYYNIKPIFIFDGDANIRQKLQERMRRRSVIEKTKVQLGSENKRQTRLKEWDQIAESLKIRSKRDLLRSEYVTAGIKDLVDIVGDEGLDTQTALKIGKAQGMSTFMLRNPRFSPTIDDILIRTRVEKLVTSVLLDSKELRFSKTRSRAQKLGQMEANLLNDVLLNKILDIPQQLKLSMEASLRDARDQKPAEPLSSVMSDQISTPEAPEMVELSQPSPLADSTAPTSIPEPPASTELPDIALETKTSEEEETVDRDALEHTDQKPAEPSSPVVSDQIRTPDSPEVVELSQQIPLVDSAAPTSIPEPPTSAELPDVSLETKALEEEETVDRDALEHTDQKPAEPSSPVASDQIRTPDSPEVVELSQPSPLADSTASTLIPEPPTSITEPPTSIPEQLTSAELPGVSLETKALEEEETLDRDALEHADQKQAEPSSAVVSDQIRTPDSPEVVELSQPIPLVDSAASTLIPEPPTSIPEPPTSIPEPPTSTELPDIALETKTIEEEETLDLETLEDIISTYKRTIELSDLRSTLLDVTSETDYYVTRLEKAVAPVTRNMIEEAKAFLRKSGVPCLTCHDHEAEAMCASLTTHGIADATVTEDMDAALFGEGVVIRQLQWKNQPMLEYSSVKAREELELSKEAFLDLCIMCGTDFGGKVEKIGPVTALKLIRQYETIENIVDNCSSRFDFPDNYLDEVRVTRQIFNKPPKVEAIGSVAYEMKPESSDLESFLALYDIQPSSVNIFNDAPQAENKNLNDMVYF
ncbi:10102_t:CDS:1 [Paraglomus occultum]|uniref:10102_t:CDS:1 n=1 Tax=Paraglomus occultum TaxID=144539 RepID=A0A9N8YZ42_9GLOM|nr:10102_t:CDS:1 [Paraglomus occultum]